MTSTRLEDVEKMIYFATRSYKTLYHASSKMGDAEAKALVYFIFAK